MTTKYFIYARKSTEDEERQIMSIEAQLAELAEYAKRENLEVVETFIESKSAKKPGREIFGKLIAAVQVSKEPVGLLCWHPDRLARNSVDGGQIIYLVDTTKIVSLRFPTFWFEPTPQGLFMLQVAFGQSKYYSDNLSENVKRGIRQKLRRGEWPTLAPFGYVNNSKTRNIEPDETKSRVIKKAFEEFAEGKHTLISLGLRLSFWGVVSKTGKPICKATIHRMLTNQVYLGLIIHNGETYEGGFPSIVSRATFEAVQNRLKQRARPRKSKVRHNFPFTGLLTCGECGGGITAQWAKGKYRYYRCTKKFGICNQPYLREELLAEQLKSRLQKVALCDDWKNKMLAKVEIWDKEQSQSSQTFAQNIQNKISETEQKLDKLVNAFLDGSIEKEIYLVKKNELIHTKTALLEKKDDFGRKGNNWVEPLKNWILSAHHAKKLASSNDLDEIKSFVEKIGTNRRLSEKTVSWDFKNPFDLLANLSADELRSEAASSKNLQSFTWSGCRESNSDYMHPMHAYYHYTTARSHVNWKVI